VTHCTIYFRIKTTARCGLINITCINILLLTTHEYPRLILSRSISAEDVVYNNEISAGSTGKHTALWRSIVYNSEISISHSNDQHIALRNSCKLKQLQIHKFHCPV